MNTKDLRESIARTYKATFKNLAMKNQVEIYVLDHKPSNAIKVRVNVGRISSVMYINLQEFTQGGQPWLIAELYSNLALEQITEAIMEKNMKVVL